MGTASSNGDGVERAIGAADGRMLTVEEPGDPDGRPVLVDMARKPPAASRQRDAAERRLRLIGYGR